MFCASNLSHKRTYYYTKHWWYDIGLYDIVHTKAVCIIFLLLFTLHDSFRFMVHLEGRVVVDFFLVVSCAWSLRWQSHLCCMHVFMQVVFLLFVCVLTCLVVCVFLFIYLVSWKGIVKIGARVSVVLFPL